MSDKTQETPAPVDAEVSSENFAQKTVKFFKTRVGKTILIGTGTVVALAGTYVAGFRNGQVDTYESLEEDDEFDYLEITREEMDAIEAARETEETEDEETEEEEN